MHHPPKANDLKFFLRKAEFPQVVHDAIVQIFKMLTYEMPVPQNQLKELIDEFVFFEVDKRGSRRTKLKSISQLQLLTQLTATFNSYPLEPAITLFLLLFPPMCQRTLEKRFTLLSRLISMSAALSNGTLLSCIGIFMQIICCQSEMSLSLTRHFLEDYFSTLPTNQKILLNLSNVSPIFCASFLTCLGHIYCTCLPPPETLAIVLEWIQNCPSICFAAAKLVLPPFCQLSFVPQSVLPGLVAWTVLLPFTTPTRNKEELHTILHLVILQSLVQIGQLQVGPCDLLSYNVLYALADGIKTSGMSLENKDVSLERMAQVIQISLASRCLPLHKEHLSQLFNLLSTVGYNRTLSIVQARWRI